MVISLVWTSGLSRGTGRNNRILFFVLDVSIPRDSKSVPWLFSPGAKADSTFSSFARR